MDIPEVNTVFLQQLGRDLRLAENKECLTAPYTFLGLADFAKYEGSRPMNIAWKLHVPIPVKYLKKTNKLVAG